jgi:hypothetical protein
MYKRKREKSIAPENVKATQGAGVRIEAFN